jgi:hypothetical protein
MTSQSLKRKLENKLDRPMSDSTWYRILSNLRALGVSNDDMDAAFELLASINKSKRSKRSRINTIRYQFKDVWLCIQKFSKAFDEHKLMNCEEFRLYLENSMVIKPKPRVNGMNTIWYTWFERGGIPYDRYEKNSITKYMPVAALAYSWEYRKQLLTIKQIGA